MYNNPMKKLLTKADCVLIKNPSNLFYFSKYQNQDAIIIFCGNKKYYLTDLRYLDEAEEVLTGFEIVDIKRDGIGTIKDILEKNKCKTLGIEDDIPLSFYNQLCNNLDFIELKDISGEIRSIRAIKNDEELEKISVAQKITDKTFIDLLGYIKEGVTERELKHILEDLIYKNGGEDTAFDTIVAFGAHTARPHAHITDQKLRKNQLIKLDFGAKYQGYCSDMTRTIAFGAPDNEQKEIYQTVLSAQMTALEYAKTGMAAKDLYHKANEYFIEKGLEKYFLHSLGHGVGVNVHETPTISPKSQDILKENMAITIEPGLYIAKKFGVRIEDMIVFKKERVINLTNSQKELIII
jgi:Xaa-Pro aminopeptidase